MARTAHRVALDPGEAADEGLAVEGLELVEPRPVHEAGDQLPRVDLLAKVGRDQAVELGRIRGGLLGRGQTPGQVLVGQVEVADDLAHERERVLVRGRVVVRDPGLARVDVGAAELLGADLLAGGGLHERWPPDEDGAGPLDDDRLVAHRGHVGAAGRAGPHHRRDLRNACRGEPGLVVEDPAEVVAVGEDLVLKREERSAGVHEVDARQAVLPGYLLSPQVLLDRHGEVRAALDRRVVGDEHALASLDDADPGDDPCAGSLAVVELPGGERRELQERRVRVEQPVDALPSGQLPARAMLLERFLATSAGDLRRSLAQLGNELLHASPALVEGVRGLDLRAEHRHGVSLPRVLATEFRRLLSRPLRRWMVARG